MGQPPHLGLGRGSTVESMMLRYSSCVDSTRSAALTVSKVHLHELFDWLFFHQKHPPGPLIPNLCNLFFNINSHSQRYPNLNVILCITTVAETIFFQLVQNNNLFLVGLKSNSPLSLLFWVVLLNSCEENNFIPNICDIYQAILPLLPSSGGNCEAISDVSGRLKVHMHEIWPPGFFA